MLGFFLFATASTQALERTQPPTQWVLKATTPEVKPMSEAEHSPLSGVKVKNANYTSTPQYVFMAMYLSFFNFN
jgi:hypothetical protein